ICAINGRRSGADARPRGPRCAAPRACAVPRRRLPGLTPNEAPRRRPQGMEKINFSGGEPFLPDRGEYLGKLVRFCKVELRLPSVSIVSNGSLIRERWFQNYGEYLDILAISCDSFDEEVNVLIGRGQGKKNHVENLQKLRR
ncbi:RSAD2 isoform 3, partial [Pan troglodytes]